MKILLLGAGQVGRTAAYHLSREPANEVTVVDTNEVVLRDLQDRLDIRAVAGNGAYPSVLESAGIADTDILGTALHIVSVIEGAALFARSTQDMKYVNRLLDTAAKIIEEISI